MGSSIIQYRDENTSERAFILFFIQYCNEDLVHSQGFISKERGYYAQMQGDLFVLESKISLLLYV